jgi:hypothetical protein
VSNVVTLWREKVVQHLRDNLHAGEFTVLSAKRQGPSRDRKLCCVFKERTTSRAVRDPGAFIAPVLIVRAWLPLPAQPRPRGHRQQGTAEPDPQELEQLEMDMWTTLDPIRALPDIGVYFEIDETLLDLDEWVSRGDCPGLH